MKFPKLFKKKYIAIYVVIFLLIAAILMFYYYGYFREGATSLFEDAKANYKDLTNYKVTGNTVAPRELVGNYNNIHKDRYDAKGKEVDDVKPVLNCAYSVFKGYGIAPKNETVAAANGLTIKPIKQEIPASCDKYKK